MKQTGELLKTSRESKNLSLHEIGMSLKINPKTLQAIEDGDVAKLPQRTFLRGFVKSYAQYLKLDVKQFMDVFDREIAGNNPVAVVATEAVATKAVISGAGETSTPVTPMPAPTPTAAVTKDTRSVPKLSERAPNHIDRSKEARTQKTLLVVGGVVLAIVIVVVAKLVSKYQKERGTNASKAEIARLQESTKAADIPPVLVDGSIATTPPTAIVDNGSGVVTPPADAVTSTALNPSAAPTPAAPATAISATPISPPIVKEAPPKEATPPAASTSTSDSDTSLAAKPQEVIVEATGKVSLTYTLDDGSPHTLEMSADEMHTFKSKNSIKLEVSDGGALNLIVNGRDKGPAGKPGQTAKLSYPK